MLEGKVKEQIEKNQLDDKPRYGRSRSAGDDIEQIGMFAQDRMVVEHYPLGH
jgi:hypothetical protein